MEDGQYLARYVSIAFEIAGQQDQLGTQSHGPSRGHRGVDAEGPGRVVAGRDDTTALPRTTDCNRDVAKFGAIAHLHGGEEAVAVAMEDLALESLHGRAESVQGLAVSTAYHTDTDAFYFQVLMAKVDFNRGEIGILCDQ